MTLVKEEVLRGLVSAYGVLLDRDRFLLEVDANERSITHKLAEYLQAEFPGWNVDCEYNRNGAIPKRLIGTARAVLTDDTEGVTVFPDIIVHRRGTDENLLVIEAKKSDTVGAGGDTQKLRAYKSERGYLVACSVVFPVLLAASDASAANDIVEVM